MRHSSLQRRVVTGSELVSKGLPTVSRPLAGMLIGVKANRIATLIDMKMIEEIVVEMGARRARVVTLESVNTYLNHRQGHPEKNLPVAWKMIVQAAGRGERLMLDSLLGAFGWSLNNPQARSRAVGLLLQLNKVSWGSHKLLLGLLVSQSVRADYPHQKIVEACRLIRADEVSSRSVIQDLEWEMVKHQLSVGALSSTPPETLFCRSQFDC